MSFIDSFKLSTHAVILDESNKVLQLKQTYTDCRWGLPGGSIESKETIHESLIRECKEELGVEIEIEYLSGVYYHSEFNSYVFIFKCKGIDNGIIKLSKEHSEYKYFDFEKLGEIQKIRIMDCMNYDGKVISRKF